MEEQYCIAAEKDGHQTDKMKEIADNLFDKYLKKADAIFTDQTQSEKDVVFCIYNVFELYKSTDNILQTKKGKVQKLLRDPPSFTKRIQDLNCNSTDQIGQVEEDVLKELAKVAAFDTKLYNRMLKDFQNRLNNPDDTMKAVALESIWMYRRFAPPTKEGRVVKVKSLTQKTDEEAFKSNPQYCQDTLCNDLFMDQIHTSCILPNKFKTLILI